MGKPSRKGKRMSLLELTDHLAGDPKAAEKLRLADNYILQQQRMGRHFRLPDEHADIEPLIERYAKDLNKFVAYVKSLRDQAPPRSEGYLALHEFYRTLEVRMIQQQRRDRARRAYAWLEKNYPKLTYEQKQRWVRKLEQQWGRERMRFLDEHRRKTGTGRLSVEEREELLEGFWAEIDRAVAKGELPQP